VSIVVWFDVVVERDACPCCHSVPFVFAVGVTVMTQGGFAMLRAVAASLIPNNSSLKGITSFHVCLIMAPCCACAQ